MAIKTSQELMEALKNKLADDTSDEAIALIEDVNDTFNDLSNRAAGDTDWKKKYEENDASWRKKYRDRFFDGPLEDPKKKLEEEEKKKEDELEKAETIGFDDLFEVKK